MADPTVLKFTMTIPVLERLIGGDSAVEVELRKSIVQEFTKRHLVAVANELKGSIEAERDRLFNQILLDTTVPGGWGQRELSLESKVLVKKCISSQIESLVHEWVEKAVQKEFDLRMPDLSVMVERHIRLVVDNLVRQKLKAGSNLVAKITLDT